MRQIIKPFFIVFAMKSTVFSQGVTAESYQQVNIFNRIAPAEQLASMNCAIPTEKKVQYISSIQANCFDKVTAVDGTYFLTMKAKCTDNNMDPATRVKLMVKSECDMQADNRRREQQAEQQRAQASSGGGGGSGSNSGGFSPKDAQNVLKAASQIQKDYKKAVAKENSGTEGTLSQPKQTQNASSASSANTASNGNSGSATAATPTATGGADSSVAAPKYDVSPRPELSQPAKGVSPEANIGGGGGSVKPPEVPTDAVKPDAIKSDAVTLDKGAEAELQSQTDRLAAEKSAIDQAKKDLPDGAKPAADKATSPEALSAADQALNERKALSKTQDEQLDTKINALKGQINSIVTASPGIVTTRCMGPFVPGDKRIQECTTIETALNCPVPLLKELEAVSAKLKTSKISCSESSSSAEQLCSMVRSPGAQAIQQLMSVGLTFLSKSTSAAESCGTTQNLSKVAQGAMMSAQLLCTGMKFRCDFSCKTSSDEIANLVSIATKITGCAQQLQSIAPIVGSDIATNLQNASANFSATLKQQLAPTAPVPAAIAQCKKHEVDILTMASQVVGLASAAKDARDCKKKLAGESSSSNGAGGKAITTAEFCSDPANAGSTTCKCSADPSAAGCLGSLGTSGFAGANVNNNGRANGFAAAGTGSLKPGENPSLKDLAGLGDEKQSVSGTAGVAGLSSDVFGGGSSAGGGAGGASAAGGGADESSTKTADGESEKGKFKFSFGNIGSALGGMFGGKAPTGAVKGSGSFTPDQLKAREDAIKRKLASDQVRAEISTASGKSNFDKISQRYRATSETLIEGQ